MKFSINYSTKDSSTTLYTDSLTKDPISIGGLTMTIKVEDDKGFITIKDDKPALNCRCPFKRLCRKVALWFGYKNCCSEKPACCKGK